MKEEDNEIDNLDIEEDYLDGIDEEDKDIFMNDSFDYMGSGNENNLSKHNGLLKELTNFDKYIKDKVNGWLGLKWDEKKKKYIDSKDIIPIMNKKCAFWCIDYLKTYTRENNIITNISKNDYRYIIEDIIDVVWIDIGTRTEEFAIMNNADLHRICVELQHASELILMGAGDGKYNEFLGKSTTRHETVSLGGQQSHSNQNYMTPKKNGIIKPFVNKFFGG